MDGLPRLAHAYKVRVVVMLMMKTVVVMLMTWMACPTSPMHTKSQTRGTETTFANENMISDFNALQPDIYVKVFYSETEICLFPSYELMMVVVMVVVMVMMKTVVPETPRIIALNLLV